MPPSSIGVLHKDAAATTALDLSSHSLPRPSLPTLPSFNSTTSTASSTAGNRRIVVFGGGGAVAKELTRLASSAAVPNTELISVVQDHLHMDAVRALGGEPHVLEIDDMSVADIADFLLLVRPDVLVWAVASRAGADAVVVNGQRHDGYANGSSSGAKDSHSHNGTTTTLDGAGRTFAAAELTGVRRVILVSTIDARDCTRPPPSHYTEISNMAWKWDTEKSLHATNLDYTLLRPGVLVDAPARGADLGIVQLARGDDKVGPGRPGSRHGRSMSAGAGAACGVNVNDLTLAALIGNMHTCSRQLLGQVLLACVHEPGTIGLTLGVMDGEHDVLEEVRRCARDQVDAWEEDEW